MQAGSLKGQPPMQVVVLGANHTEDEIRFGGSYHKQKEGAAGQNGWLVVVDLSRW